MGAIICKSCGKELSDDERSCPRCGGNSRLHDDGGLLQPIGLRTEHRIKHIATKRRRGHRHKAEYEELVRYGTRNTDAKEVRVIDRGQDRYDQDTVDTKTGESLHDHKCRLTEKDRESAVPCEGDQQGRAG